MRSLLNNRARFVVDFGHFDPNPARRRSVLDLRNDAGNTLFAISLY